MWDRAPAGPLSTLKTTDMFGQVCTQNTKQMSFQQNNLIYEHRTWTVSILQSGIWTEVLCNFGAKLLVVVSILHSRIFLLRQRKQMDDAMLQVSFSASQDNETETVTHFSCWSADVLEVVLFTLVYPCEDQILLSPIFHTRFLKF